VNKKKSIISSILFFCAYTHLWNVIKKSVKERKLPAAARPGAMIFLLGIFCPLFWIALFSGARGAALSMHAIHSGIVAGIGLVIMIAGLFQK
jgi:hypothetical protein